MFKDLTYKKKFIGLIVLFALLSYVAYQRSFKGTLNTVSFYYKSKANISKTSDINYKLIKLKKESAMLNMSIGKKVNDPVIVQNKILNFLSNQKNNLTLSKISKIHISENDYFTIYSNKITLKGDYNTLIQTIYKFEKEFDYARIANMKFFVKRNPKTSEKELFNDIIFQNYEKKK